MIKKALLFVQFFVGFLVIGFLPGVLLLVDPGLITIAPIYIPIILIFATVTSIIIIKRQYAPNSLKSIFYNIFPLASVLLPFLLIALYPFAPMDFLLTVVLVLIGIYIPFLGKPKKASEVNKKSRNLQKYVWLGISGGIMTNYLYKLFLDNGTDARTLFFMKCLSLVAVFIFSWIIGYILRNKNIKNI